MINDFNYDGLWWHPENPEKKISGALNFTLDDGAKLNLIGSFGTVSDFFQGDIERHDAILGISPAGHKISIYNSIKINSKYSASGFTVDSYIVPLVFIGEHFNKLNDVKFKSLNIVYSHLDAWVNISGFKFELEPNEYTIKYKKPDSVCATLRDCNVSIGFNVSGPDWSIVQKSTRINQESVITIDFMVEKTFDECLDVIYLMQNFLSLGVGEPVKPLEIKGFLDKKSSPHGIEILYTNNYIRMPVRDIIPPHMIFNLNDISEKFEEYLNNWFENAELLKPVYDLYFGTLYNQRMYQEQQFLSLVQAIESYHRRRFKSWELPPSDHDQRLKKIYDSTPDEHKEWLKGKLNYSNESNLRKRLKEIFKRYPSIVLINRNKFINDVVNTRNYLTHYDNKLKNVAITDEKGLYNVTEKLKNLIEICLFTELGFNDDEIKKTNSYNNFIKN